MKGQSMKVNGTTKVIVLKSLSLAMVFSLITACNVSENNELPRYPGSRIINSQSGKSTVKGATVTYSTYETFDNYGDVVKFYDERLASRPGWKARKGSEMTFLGDGNIQVDRSLTSGVPRDPSRTGGEVEIYRGEGKVIIIIIASKPGK